ncbi:MAG: hypothetical protein H0T42_30385 [Deltaproteobacteria bacterium]|nr:hypothetical protein [Deltaproteobacteria bacterium]
MTMDKLFLALHVIGALMWVGSLFALMAFLEAYAGEPEAAPRGRLLKHLRQAAIVPDVGATIAIVFGAHWLFRFKLYEAHYMHAKLALVAVVIGLHVMLKLKVKKAKRGEAFAPPPLALKPMLTLLALGIVIFVITKVPA